MPKELTFDSLTSGWGQAVAGNGPYVFPGDASELLGVETSECSKLDVFLTSGHFGNSDSDGVLQLGVMPSPYDGDLRRAKVFILIANPGLNVADFLEEEPEYEAFRRVKQNTLQQKNIDKDFPFTNLNPRFAWHPGFRYWYRDKLGELIRLLAEGWQISHLMALQRVAQQIACIDLLGYHSVKFRSGKLLHKLPSVQLIKQYVHDELLPKARNDAITIIVARASKKWGLEEQKNVVVYSGWEAQHAYLTPNSRGGMAIMERLKDGGGALNNVDT